MQVFNRQVSVRGLTVFGFETLLISASILLAARVHGSYDDAVGSLWKIVLVTAVAELCFYYNDLYDLTVVQSTREMIIRVLQAAGVTAIVLAALSIVMPSLLIGRGIFLTSLLLTLVAVPAWRLAFDGVARDAHLIERVLIVGTGAAGVAVVRQIESQRDFAYHVVGALDDGGDGSSLPVVGAVSDISEAITRHRITRVVVALSDRRGRLPIRELLQAKLAGVHVEDATTMYERLTGKILLDDLKPSWLIFSDGFRASRITRAAKRSFDFALALVAVVMAAPLMVATAVAIRLESRGPVLYSQERVGENGRRFVLYKFRSMRTDAERGTPVWASENDERVTRVGRVIRLTRLDELPQLWNVIRGDMSFVGPRPERPFFVEQLAAVIPFYLERHSARPGVTGWAQVKYRYGSSIEDATEKLRYDLYYIKHQSIVFDLTILIDTVKVIVSGKGAK